MTSTGSIEHAIAVARANAHMKGETCGKPGCKWAQCVKARTTA